jgi:hypothetical protein
MDPVRSGDATDAVSQWFRAECLREEPAVVLAPVDRTSCEAVVPLR